MKQHHPGILNTLKDAYQYENDGYGQRLAADSLNEDSAVNQHYQLRILLLTNCSPYLDGIDLEVILSDNLALINEEVYRSTTLLQGSPMMDA